MRLNNEAEVAQTLSAVSILIPTYNRCHLLMQCLNSLCALRFPRAKMQIIVWDNHSGGETVRKIGDRLKQMKNEGWLDVSLIESDMNIGPSLPYNRISPVIHPDSKYLLGLDDDVVLTETCLAELLAVAKTTPNAAVIGARARWGTPPFHISSSAGFINWWIGRFRMRDSESPLNCNYVIGCCWLIKISVLKELRGVDEDYFTMHWEIDFCTRAQKSNYAILYAPQAQLTHNTTPRKRSGLYYIFRNKILFIRKNAPLPQQISSFTIYTVILIPKAVLQSIRVNRRVNWQELREILRGVWDGFRGIAGRHPLY